MLEDKSMTQSQFLILSPKGYSACTLEKIMNEILSSFRLPYLKFEQLNAILAFFVGSRSVMGVKFLAVKH